MSVHVHELSGCAPAPLAHYLKAIGVLRLIAEQKDPEARGWWEGARFRLMTRLSESELVEFFLAEYAPTPMFNPWGARSGYYSGSSESSARRALAKIEQSGHIRLAPFRQAIAETRNVVLDLGNAKPNGREESKEMLDRLHRGLRGSAASWMDTVQVLVEDAYRPPPILGTGGNEGSGSYTSGYMAAVANSIVDRASDDALGLLGRHGARGAAAVPNYTWDGAFGQFVPAGEGSAWDLIFALEGAVVFRSSVTLKSSGERRLLSSPFYLAPHASGNGTMTAFDEVIMNKGRASPGRGEQWFPVWERPSTFRELEAVIGEGRCSNGRSRATHPLDAARAVGRLGVARGLSSFLRYGYVQRNNLATHFAVPLGRIQTERCPSVRLLDDLSPWMKQVWKASRSKGAPSRLVVAERRLADAAFQALLSGGEAWRWQAVLLAASEVEKLQTSGSPTAPGPIPVLSPDWLVAANDGSPEWRLAVALGSAAGRDENGRRVNSIRHNWLPLKRGGRKLIEHQGRVARDPQVVITGRAPVADLGDVMERRLIERRPGGGHSYGLFSPQGYGAAPSDLAAFIQGNLDDFRILNLALALMGVNWTRVTRTSLTGPAPLGLCLDEAWVALRLALAPRTLPDGRTIRPDSRIVRRLLAGDASSAVQLALHRLRADGLRPPLRGAFADPQTARRWAAALAFPVSQAWVQEMTQRFGQTHEKETR